MKKKKIIIIISIILLITVCISYAIIQNKDNSQNLNNEEILDPNRIVIKIESNYYEITRGDENYEKLVQLCRESFKKSNEQNITEEEIDNLKKENDFVEFDYDTISKNNIFFLSGDIGAIKMKDKDGTIISKKAKNSKKIINELKNAIAGKNAYQIENEKIEAKNSYEYYPSTVEFKEIKYSAVFKKELKNYEQYEKIIELYHLDFGDIDIKDKFETNKIILFLSKYNISDYKVNIGNIKINFEGNDYIVPTQQNYKPIILIVSKIVNTNCIYYNYDNVTEIDNLTGTTEEIYGVVKSKNDDGSINLGYNTDNDNMITGIIRPAENTSLEELEIGDFIQAEGTITNFNKDTKIKTYEPKQLNINKKENYEKQMSDYLKGKDRLDTNIIDYYSSESGYDGWVICPIYLDEESSKTNGYVKIYYDFYNGNTESYLGMGTYHLASNYGIHKYEIVTITLKDKITDTNKLEAKMFEYIAD